MTRRRFLLDLTAAAAGLAAAALWATRREGSAGVPREEMVEGKVVAPQVVEPEPAPVGTPAPPAFGPTPHGVRADQAPVERPAEGSVKH